MTGTRQPASSGAPQPPGRTPHRFALRPGGETLLAPLEDTGDREVQQAEAEIGHESLPELGAAVPDGADAEAPALPNAEAPPAPEEDRPGELPQPKPGPGTTEAA